MILKQEKNSKGFWFALIGIVGLVVLSILSLDFGQYNQYKRDLTVKWMSQDLGFSQAHTPDVFVKRFKNKLPGIVKGRVLGFEGRPNIDRIDIDVKFADMQKILSDRKRALENTILKNPTKVPAKLRYKGKTYKAKIRLKGDLKDHWSEDRRMSFRVSLSGKNSIFGYKAFSIHKPGVRQHPHDQAYQAIRQTAGGLSANHTYAHIFVNGEKWGVMNVEEHMTKELLEKERYKESLIFRFGSEDGWVYSRRVGDKSKKIRRYRIGDNVLNSRVYGASKYLENDIYRQWYSYIIRNRLSANPEEIYDIDKFSRGVILAKIWNNTHTLAHANSRYYFNPYTLKLEPITTDQGIAFHLKDDKPTHGFDYHLYKMYQEVVGHEDYAKGFSKRYKDVREALLSSQPIFERFHSYFPLDGKPNFKKIIQNAEVADRNYDDYFAFPTKQDFQDMELNQKRKINRVKINPYQAETVLSHVHAQHYTDGRIEIFNLLPADLDLVDIRVDGESVADLPKTVPAYKEVSYVPQLTLQTPHKDLRDGQITVVTGVHNQHREFTIPYTLVAENLFNPLAQDNAETFDFITQRGDGDWAVKTGKWMVRKPIYIQGDLHVGEGTELTFTKNSYMVVHGDLTVNGTAKAKVIFKPKNKKHGWKGLYVLGGDKGSELTHMNIKDTRALEHGLLKLTGGTTFYRTRAVLKYVKFLGTEAEDAINLVHTNFAMKKVTVSHTRSDGFDGDFSNGDVIDSLFEYIGGDALDYSGSKVKIKNPRIRFVKDKAVSVGEASDVTLNGGKIANIGVAIASKDGSKAKASNVHIRDFELSAAMTYVKKPFYGAPSLVVSDSQIEGKGHYFRQVGTSLLVDNKKIPSQKIDVDTLYQSGVMKK